MAKKLKTKPSCYDCGSTIKGHHTPLCEMVGKGEKRDLPAVPGTQWWTKREQLKD